MNHIKKDPTPFIPLDDMLWKRLTYPKNHKTGLPYKTIKNRK